MNQIQLFGKYIGQINGNKFVTHRRPEHFFIKYKGFGISTSILQKLKTQNIKEIVILYGKKNGDITKYQSTIEQFYNQGEHWTDKTGDTQLILNITYMKR